VRGPDSVDFRILRELANPEFLQWNVRESYAGVAKKIGIDPETVRRRVRRMTENGAIRGWRLGIHPRIFGFVDVHVHLEVREPTTKSRAVAQLEKFEGIVLIRDFVGKELYVILYAQPSDVDTKIGQIRGICQADDLTSWTDFLPPCSLEASATDWKMIWAMKDDPRKSVGRVAKEARLSVRTVNRRLSRLRDGRAVFLQFLPRAAKIAGVNGHFLIFCPDPQKRASAAQRIKSKFERAVFVGLSKPPYLICNVAFSNLQEVDEANDWVESLDGVQSTRVRILKDYSLPRDWLYEEIKKRAFAG